MSFLPIFSIIDNQQVMKKIQIIYVIICIFQTIAVILQRQTKERRCIYHCKSTTFIWYMQAFAQESKTFN